MKTWLYLPLLLLGFILPGCTKKTTEIVIPNQTILYQITPDAWGYDNSTGIYYYVIKTPELNGVSKTDGVIVSMARFSANGQTPQSYELLPQVYNNQSYFVIHDDAKLEVDIKGINGAASVKPATAVWIKIVLIPSVGVN
ncbi:hypothetical protein FHW36_11659 [Chitinophaga polysaccharea]|uniref:Uncharacterized protein n=1 Tax=Chitinophaga polysaccharea TaxID=1293035 RepID=A0A561P2N3_9BACT|nr:hypothetical protein [Chitinophaga polysaccharea]TWF32386.1 hypothetical protein FHW36_11659 [Chitinophaga polysaccharea]